MISNTRAINDLANISKLSGFYLETPLKNFIAVFWRTWVVLLAPFLLSPLLFISLGSEVGEALRCAYTILLMAAYWLTEALPLPITSMIPMVLLPMLGVMSTGTHYTIQYKFPK